MASLFPIRIPKLGDLRFSDAAMLNGLVYLDNACKASTAYLTQRGFTVDAFELARPEESRFRVNVLQLGDDYPTVVVVGGVINVDQALATAIGQIESQNAMQGLNPYWFHSAEIILSHLYRIFGGRVQGREFLWIGHSGGGAVVHTLHAIHAQFSGWVRTSCISFGAPAITNDPHAAARGMPNMWRFINVGDPVPGMPTPQHSFMAGAVARIVGYEPAHIDYYQFSGGIALDKGTYFAPVVSTWASQGQRITEANTWVQHLIEKRPTSHDIRAYIQRLRDAERETLVAEASAVVIPSPQPDDRQLYIMPFALQPFRPRQFAFPSNLIRPEVKQMIVIPKTDKAQAIQLGGEFWVVWMGLQLVKCPTLGKAKTTAKKWNLLLYHIGVRGGVVAVDTLKQAWQLFLDAATADPAFKPQWVNAS